MSRSKKKRISGFEAWEQSFGETDHQPLLDRLGVALDDEHLKLALTHRSFANENGTLPNNERLEFLGDAVLGLVIAEELYTLHPSRPESDISKMRASIVSRYGLADIAQEIDLGSHILLGKGELVTGGREKDSILADTTEALLGAIYRQHGFSVTRDVIVRLFRNKIDNATATGINHDWKTTLQERIAALGGQAAVYEATSVGPDHDLTFTAYCVVDGNRLGKGVGPNKKLAEQQAAREAFQVLQQDPTKVKNA